MDKSGDSKWGELINRHEISSACPRVDAETIAKTGETLSNSQSTGGGGGGGQGSRVREDEVRCSHWNKPSKNFGPLTHYHSVNKREPVTLLLYLLRAHPK